MTTGKTRVVVLGGGPAALAAIWEITESPDWQDRFEIDVYTMGWRLGGKCASGRNQVTGENFEHGLHLLCGFYHNTFGQVVSVYDEWKNESSDCPLKFKDSFIKKKSFSLMQKDPLRWREVKIEFQDNGKCPGKDPPTHTILETVTNLARWLGVEFSDTQILRSSYSSSYYKNSDEDDEFNQINEENFEEISLTLKNAADQLEQVSGKPVDEEIIDRVVYDLEGLNIDIRRRAWPIQNADLWGLANLIITIVKGALKDRVWDQGYDVVNDLEMADWLSKHGASRRVLRSAVYQAMYHYAFGYVAGDPQRPNIAAGTGLRNFLRMMLHVHGSIFYHMDGGMGEVYVLPYYDVLRRRGVKFNFFHKVLDVVPNENHEISQIELQVQAQTKKGTGVYKPIVKIPISAGSNEYRRTWPVRPDFEQLQHGKELEKSGLDLENALDQEPPGSTTKSLSLGKDFDICVLAIPPSISKSFTRQLGVKSARWKAMIEHAASTPTISAQLWSKVPVKKIRGFTKKGLVTGGKLPLDTWADMSFLLNQELNPSSKIKAKSLSYFVGAFPEKALDGGSTQTLAEETTKKWLKANAPRFMPGFCKRGVFSYDHVIALYSQINGDPAKQYVLTPADSVKYRMRCDGADFSNLFLAGDWTKNNSDMGAVESAVISGQQCARAISGYPAFVYGESDFG